MIQMYKVDKVFKTCYFQLFSYFHGILGILLALDETCFAYNFLAKSPIPGPSPGPFVSTLNVTSSPDPKEKT